MQQLGRVTLVGAGPGAPGLLTLRGKQVLEQADVVLYDRLVGGDILAMIPDGAEKVDVGKSAGRHALSQNRINEEILRYARHGRHVVRLKGGDPYLFGRGAEELEAVAAQGIPFEVVPGVTSAIAVPGYGGIPVTHREHVSSLHIITGHARQGGKLDIPYESLAKLGGTLVFLMGVGAIAELTRGLVEAGMDAQTPAALVENGTRPQQRQLAAPLDRIAAEAVAQGYRPPSVLVVGTVCALAEELNWHARLPLAGVRVLVTRPRAAAGELSGRLRDLGCAVTEYPCIRTQALPVAQAVFEQLPQRDWIVFTSPVGAELFFAALLDRGLDARALHRAKIAAVGAKTASVVRERGIVPDLVPPTYHAESLAASLIAQARPGQRTLLFRARGGTPRLPEALRKSGLEVEDIAAYETVYESPDSDTVRPLLENGDIDFVTFTSASTVHGFAKSLDGLHPGKVRGVCIGEETAAAARGYGFAVSVSEQATIDSLIACLQGSLAGAGDSAGNGCVRSN